MTAGWRVRLGVSCWRHGGSWWIAILLVGVAVAMQLAWIEPRRAEHAQLQAATAQMRQATLRLPTAPAMAASPGLDAVRAVLPPAAESGERVRQMARLAQVHGIATAQADYLHQAHGSIGVLQLQVTQPLRAPYPQLRAYLEAVLREMPNATLDQVTARRENVGQTQLEARLRWSLWHQAVAAGPQERP